MGMSTLLALGIALVLSLLAFPLVSAGFTQDTEALWWVGIALLVIGGLIPPATRFAFADDGDGDGNGDGDDHGDDDETDD
jgi:hypothetical protein